MAVRQFVKFSVGSEEFGVDIKQVVEIIKLQEVFKVPNTPPFIEGLINLRGRVLTVFNLRKRLGMEHIDFDANSKIIIVNYNDIMVGFTVDLVSEIVRVDDDNIESTPPAITGFDKRFLSGVAKLGEKLILTLNLQKVLTPDDQNEIREFVEENEENVLK